MKLRNATRSRYTVVAADDVWYHGRKSHSQAFSLDHVGKENANDQEGPGFYFTSDLDDARSYAAPDGIVMRVTLKPRKLVEGKPKRSEVEKLMRMSSNLDDTLMDWNEDPRAAFRQALDGNLGRNDTAKDAFQQVWYDFYRYQPKEYLVNMVKLGYDGHEATWLKGDVRHMVVYNPSSIHVQKITPYAEVTCATGKGI